MLRTVVIRNELLKGTLKKAIRLNAARALSVECTRRRHKNHQPSFLKPAQNTQWKSDLLRFYSALPPHQRVLLPALSPTMEAGTIISWEKKEGDKLNEGDLLAEIETDKATMGFETPEEGYLAKIIVAGGTKNVPIGKLVCIIVSNQADVAAFKDFKDDGAAAPAPRAAPPPAAAPPSAPSAPSAPPPAPTVAESPTPNVEHSKILLPALSPTMEVGTIISWEKKEGDKLKEGDLLAEIETDKATMGFETPEEGYLAKILVPGGSKNVPIGKLVCIIVQNQADVAAFKDFKAGSGPAAAAAPSAPRASAPAAAAPMAASPAVAAGARVYASPMAKRLAEKRQVRLQGKGTGLFDSITSKDVPQAGAAPTPAAAAAGPRPAAGKAPKASSPTGVGSPYTDTPIPSIRQVIAKRLTQSKQLVPHYYVTDEIIVDKLLATRGRLNKALEKEKVKLSINDFVVKALALAVQKVPCANSSWMDNSIRQYKNVDVSIAVATDKGLITPIIFQADLIGLSQISKSVKELAGRARQNKLQPHEFQGGTITVSNLGMFDVNHFTAIINPPQSCILAVGTLQKKLVIDAKAERGFKEISYMAVTLSCDHRTVDGAEGAKVLQHLRTFMENPETMLL